MDERQNNTREKLNPTKMTSIWYSVIPTYVCVYILHNLCTYCIPLHVQVIMGTLVTAAFDLDHKSDVPTVGKIPKG